MPYRVKREDDGYRVENAETGRTYSKKPMPLARAERQLTALRIHGGGPMPNQSILHQIELATGREAPAQIGQFRLVHRSPTLVFYVAPPPFVSSRERGEDNKGTVVIGVRGMRMVSEDIWSDINIAFSTLEQTQRYQNDLADIKNFMRTQLPSKYDYYAVGHSLGGAIVDALARSNLVQRGRTYNSAIEPLYKNERITRIYNKNDPLLFLFRPFIHPPPEVREGPDAPLEAHEIGSFNEPSEPINGSGRTFKDQLRESGLDAKEYLKEAQKKAKESGLAWKLLGFADDGKHKLAIPNPDGKIIRFGAVEYGDYILWSHAETTGEVPEGFAEKKRDTFHKSHTKIRGEWAKDKYSPNSLALSVLW